MRPPEVIIQPTNFAATFGLKSLAYSAKSRIQVVLALPSLLLLFLLCSPVFAQTKLTPASVAFGSLAVGETSTARTVTFDNAQKTPVTIDRITISGENAPTDFSLGTGTCPTSPNTLAVGNSCTIPVIFAPSALGNLISTLTVTSSSSSSPQSVALSGIGTAPVTVAPTSLTLASTFVGNTSAAKTVTLTNHLNVTLTLSSPTTTGDFAVASTGTCGSTVGAGLTCTIAVTFTPNALGTLSGTLTIGYAGFGSPISVPLTGTGNDTGLTSITVAPTTPSIPAGATQQFTATGHAKGGGTENLSSFVTWTSGTPSIATIAPGGLATAVKAGTANVSAQLGTFSGSTLLTVTPPPALVSIAVTPVSPSIAKGTTQQFTAIGTYTDSSTHNLTSSVTWASSTTSVAIIAAGGLASGVNTGTSNITATLGSVASSPDTLTVTNAALVSIAVTPANPSIAAGTTEQFNATGTYSDSSTQNLTSSVTWSSLTPSVATISNATGSQGLAAGMSAGSTTIKASSGTISGSTTLTVTAGFVTTGNLNNSREYHSATLLNNGMVLMAGGENSGGILSTAELYNSATGNFALTGNLNNAREYHTASVLNNGMVLLVGGEDSNGVLASAELYNSATGTFTPTGSLNTARYFHTATVLSNGMVLIAGGLDSYGHVLASAELYNPATGNFTTTGSLNIARDFHTATLLNNGMVLIAGGNGAPVASAELYNPATGSFTPTTGSLNVARSQQTATLLNNGMVLVAGGNGSAGVLNSAELYDSVTQSFTLTTGSLNTAREWQTATLLTNGTVLIAGGDNNGVLATAELYDPVAQSFTLTATSLNTARAWQTATLLDSSAVLIAGGDNNGVLASAELYEPATFTPPNLVSISLSPSTPTITPSTSQELIATGTFSNGSTQQLASATWSTSNSAVVSVSADVTDPGFAFALASGSATVSACTGSVCGSATVNVGPALVSIAVTPANGTYPPGAPVQFDAVGTFADSSTQDLTAVATWVSSVPTIATISNSYPTQGQATPVSFGTTTISAIYAAVTGSTPLTITTSATLQSITVAPAGVSLGLGGTQQFTATGNYSDGSTVDLTQVATWTSGNPTDVSVSNSGLATVVSTAGSPAAFYVTASFVPVGPLGTNTSWVSVYSTLPISCPTPTIDMQLLVINNAEANGGAGYADFPAIQQILNYLGTPYQVVDVSGTLPPLSDGACHGYYQGIIYAFGDDIYTNSSFYQALTPYEQTFHVRQLNWFTNPTPDFGFNDTSSYITDTGTDTGSFTADATPVFFYANTTTPVSISNAYIYLTTPTAPTGGGSVTQLLVDPAGNTLSGITNFSDGRQYLSQMFDSNQYLTHDQVLAYGLINWVTQGIFLGDYHVYASPQVDDFFIDDSEWIPGTSCQDPITHDRTPPDASNLPVFRVNSADMAQVVAWQNGIQSDPSGLFSNFKLTLAFNGVGTAGNGDWTGLTAPVTATTATNNLATFTTSDFSGMPGDQVTITGTTNGGGIFNGTWAITSVASNSATTPATTLFTAAIPGAGTIAQQSEAAATASIADDLVANLQSYQGSFHWISHTFDHPNTLNGMSQSTPNGGGDDINLEVLTNLWVASSPGGQNLDTDPSDTLTQLTFSDFNPANMLTPGITGLNDPNVPGYLNADGIQYVVTDTSVLGQPNNGPNPSPNVGIVNSYDANLYEVPRHPNDIYYNVANWNDDQAEFDCIYSYPTADPPFNTYTAAQILSFVSSSFVSNMLIGDMDPEMFHQPDLHFSINTAPGMPSTGQVTSLLADTYNQTFSLYKQLYNLPVLSPTLDDLGQAMQNRNAFNQSGVTASIVGAWGPNATISVTVPSSAPAPAVVPITGLNSTGAEVYGGQYISHVSMTPGQTITLPLQ